jgi:hypothetical protein
MPLSAKYKRPAGVWTPGIIPPPLTRGHTPTGRENEIPASLDERFPPGRHACQHTAAEDERSREEVIRAAAFYR